MPWRTVYKKGKRHVYLVKPRKKKSVSQLEAENAALHKKLGW